ncbi:SET domain-containing protein [Foetidibacter luteolus]|uniref:SET domain-containing protein n=1 Tax=Foetidibacter luteolus TaxID=2608880 RepID=UPI00129C0DEE|nr:SET domain-containing protein-lysine N-methyltransferase [Foetidibacter luteolus]
MALLEKQLVVKKSTLPNAGKGLFTREFIPKGTRIVEYTGTVTTWKEVEHNDGANGYIFYVSSKYVINAAPHKEALARYANDARGFSRAEGKLNNACYEKDGNKVYIKSTKNIEAGSEIFVSYGKEYWDTMKKNAEIG